MRSRFIYTSLSRIANLPDLHFAIQALPRSEWSSGDYVLCKVTQPGGPMLKLELTNGRHMDVMEGDLVVGALGIRHATLEATGTWEAVEDDGIMHLLTAAGLFGKLTSKSVYVPQINEVRYLGHVIWKNLPVNMMDFVPEIPIVPFQIPVVLLVGTSMSAGKTTASRIVTQQLKRADLKVVAAKLTGAGRYKDILTVKDAGADYIYDFVEVGLASSICPKETYLPALDKLLSMIAQTHADVGVFEIGSSPLEPYNGDVAIEMIRDQIKCVILAASDPYAAYGVMKGFGIQPDIITGIATNTIAGIELVEKLCRVKALNLVDPHSLSELRDVLSNKLGIKLT